MLLLLKVYKGADRVSMFISTAEILYEVYFTWCDNMQNNILYSNLLFCGRSVVPTATDRGIPLSHRLASALWWQHIMTSQSVPTITWSLLWRWLATISLGDISLSVFDTTARLSGAFSTSLLRKLDRNASSRGQGEVLTPFIVRQRIKSHHGPTSEEDSSSEWCGCWW